MLIVSDVHGAFDALAALGESGETVLVLGDLVNLVDYRDHSGIVPDVIGHDLVREIVDLRTQLRFQDARLAWEEGTSHLDLDVRKEIADRMEADYHRMERALEGVSAYVIHGNVDDPLVLRRHLPPASTWADGRTFDFGGETFGFVGGGLPRIGSPGEVDDDTMREKLAALGAVDVLCTHVPPALPMLSEDVIGGPEKGSRPVVEYLEEHGPRVHYFGDVHQPRASRLLHGNTMCVNVGYFRATGRALRHG